MLLVESSRQRLQVLSGRRLKDFAVAGGSFVHTKAQIRRDERFHAIKEEIVKLGTGLAADFDGVFKTGGRDQCHARAFALQQSICANCGAVQKDVIERPIFSDFVDSFDNRLRRISRRRENLEHSYPSAIHPDAIGEGAAGVDGDVERLSSGWTGMEVKRKGNIPGRKTGAYSR